MNRVVFVCLILLGFFKFSNGLGCAYWCKADCGLVGNLQYFCCSFDPFGREESFIKAPCEKERRSRASVGLTVDSVLPHPRPVVQLGQCPINMLKPQERNCVEEMKDKVFCSSLKDCGSHEVCCSDTCLPPELKVCKNALMVPTS